MLTWMRVVGLYKSKLNLEWSVVEAAGFCSIMFNLCKNKFRLGFFFNSSGLYDTC